jgi:transcriptional regulator with GAF, ATPase, and Fis domain
MAITARAPQSSKGPRPRCALTVGQLALAGWTLFERSPIVAELRRQGGGLAHSAEALRAAKTTLHDKIRRYGLRE